MFYLSFYLLKNVMKHTFSNFLYCLFNYLFHFSSRSSSCWSVGVFFVWLNARSFPKNLKVSIGNNFPIRHNLCLLILFFSSARKNNINTLSTFPLWTQPMIIFMQRKVTSLNAILIYESFLIIFVLRERKHFYFCLPKLNLRAI